MQVLSRATKAPINKKYNSNPGQVKLPSQHIKVVADVDNVGLHRHSRETNTHFRKKEKAISRAYRDLIASLTPKEFATIEASCGDKNSALEVLATLSLMAPDKFKTFLESTLKFLPKGVKSPVSKLALSLTKMLAKISGVKIAQPTTEHYTKRPTPEIRLLP